MSAVVPLAAVLAGPASADTFTVTTAMDNVAGSLRDAVAAAEAHNGDDEIDIQAGLGTITITSEIAWSEGGALSINGNRATLTGPGVARGLVDNAGEDLTINDLTITGFGGSTDNDAAPVVQEGGGLTLSGCTITGNAIVSTGDDVAGAALTEGGETDVTNCTMTGNTATTPDGDVAGGLLSEGGPTTITTSTINCNTGTNTTEDGGGATGGFSPRGGVISINGTSVRPTPPLATATSNQILIEGGGFDGTGNTISDDTGVCTAAASRVTPHR